MNNAHYNRLFAYLREGYTIITPNNRLAKTLLGDYLQNASENILEKPDCLSYDAFLQQLYFKLTHHAPSEYHPILLTMQQASFLWQEQLTMQLGAVHQGLIQKAYDAWSRCLLWQIDTKHAQFAITEQTLQFQTWCQVFSQKLKSLNLKTTEQLVPYFLKLTIPELPKQLVWFCFDEYTPQQEALQAYFSEQGIINHYVDLLPNGPTPLLCEATDETDELNTLIAWLKQQLSLNKKRIAVVIPELTQKAKAMYRLLQQHFPTEVFNLSLGKTLADYAIVSHALCWIGLSPTKLSQEEASILLSSPFLTDSTTELLPRAEFLQRNSLLEEREISKSSFTRELMQSSPLLATALKAITPYPKQQTTHAWATLFQERLALLGFPGDTPLDSANYQCYQRYLLLFDDFKQLALLKPSMSSEEALRFFNQLAKNTIFQPEKLSAAPIHILGLLEAAGCPFDAVWVTGLTDDCLPKKTQFTPFIPIALQKDGGLPYSSYEKEFSLGHKTLARFSYASPVIIFSYAQYTEDKANRLTPLLIDLAPFSLPSESYTSVLKPSYQGINYQENYQFPLLSTDTKMGSTALLANQAKCPFRAFAAHRLHLKKGNEISDGPNARERGTLLHKIMELFWGRIKNQVTLLNLDEHSLASHIEAAINEAMVPLARQRNYSFPALIQAIEQKRLKQLVEALLDWERQRPNFTVAALEANYVYELSGISFNVRIDRLDALEQGAKWVIDYKTSLPLRNPWKEDRPSEPQILLYALLDEQIDTLLFVQLKNGQVQANGLSQEDHCLPGIKAIPQKESWQGLKMQWHQQLTALAQEFADGICEPKPQHASICELCDFPDLCRLPFKT